MITTSLSSVTGRAKAKIINMNPKTIPLNTLRTSFNLKSFIHTLAICLAIIPLFKLNAQEPTMAMVSHIYDNTYQKFQVSGYSFICKPYGIVTIESLLNDEQLDEGCRSKLQRFYLKQPELSSFVYKFIHTKSFYHLEYTESSCLVYVKGQESYSELILREGLGRIEKNFKNRIFKKRFERMQRIGENSNKGVYKDPDVYSCIKNIN